MFIVRQSKHIQEDIKRNWSSWNYGEEGIKATAEQIEAAKEACLNDDTLPFIVSGFEFYGDQVNDMDLRELYPNYWVLVDERFVSAIAGVALNANTLEDAIKEAKKTDCFGDGIAFDASTAKLVYSQDEIHIFEV